jgi:hypothetical protein
MHRRPLMSRLDTPAQTYKLFHPRLGASIPQ